MAENHNSNAELEFRRSADVCAMRLLLLLFLVAAVLAACGKESEMQIMPRQLLHEARKHDCEQVSDFFSVVAAYGPPFVYGFVKGSDPSRYYGLNSAAFWCRKRSDPQRYLLIAVVDEELRDIFSCPSMVIEMRDYIGALSHREEAWDLATFREVKTDKGAGKGVYQGTALVSATEAYEDIFLCYKGHWLRQQRD